MKVRHGGANFSLLSSGNVAFVIVVCAAYASAVTALIYSRRSLPAWEVAALIAAGIAYLSVGTYGFTICRRSFAHPASFGGPDCAGVAFAGNDPGMHPDLCDAGDAFITA